MARFPTIARRSLRFLLLAPIALSLSACATAWARGVVRDLDGRPVREASIALSPSGASRPSATGRSDANGCFNVLAHSRQGQSSFVLTVDAPRFKGVSVSFSRPERLTVAITLLTESEPGASVATPMSPSEQARAYEEPCIPVSVPGATGIGIH